jgi:hypothetical protein
VKARREQTFSFDPGDAVVRGLGIVALQRNGESEWIAISRSPAAMGETLILDVDEGEKPRELVMCVIESHRFLLEGHTRHWIRLQAMDLSPVLFEQQVRRG